ncbi:hypothetical protein CR969_00590 [Candidatus Saccharibacteria bacterium]|nr:MAG: hypothetical protein CR969_00590 [Candidatus Saccharibacteria bacterium]
MNVSEQGFDTSNADAVEAKKIAEAYAVPANYDSPELKSINPRLSEMAVRSSQDANEAIVYPGYKVEENLSEKAAEYVSAVAREIERLRSNYQSGA